MARELAGATRLKWVLREIDRRSSTGDGVLLAVSRHVGVVPREAITDRESRSESLEGYKVVKAGQFAVNKMRAFNGALGVAPCDGLISPAYSVFDVAAGCDGRYLAYALRTPLGLGKIASRLRGIGQVDQGNVRTPTLSSGDLGAIALDLPELKEQQRIADYLDRETALIDALIKKKQRLAELLEERLAALVEDMLFTPGTDGPTGVARFLAAKITDGPHETPEFLDEGVPFISIEALVDDRINMGLARFVSVESHQSYSRKCRPQKGDVLLAKTGATIGKTAIVETEEEFSIWSPLALLRPKPEVLRTEYLWFFLRSKATQRRIRDYATQSTQPNIAMSDIAALPIRVPSLSRQDEIIRRLRVHSDSVEQVRTKLVHQVALLHERRQALITAAVTGQLEIRQAP